MISVTETLSISKSELEERFVRSPGPGGQNVNKVATAVQLRFDAERSPNLTSALRRRLRAARPCPSAAARLVENDTRPAAVGQQGGVALEGRVA